MCELSVLLPVNKDDGFLKKSIMSILEQTFVDFELIILANNCSDILWEEITSIALLDKRIKVIRIKLGGLTFALNYGLNIASGKYIARMDADDVALNNKFEKQMQYFSKNPECLILGTQITYIDEHDRIIDVGASILPSKNDDLVKTSKWKCPLYHPTVIFNKNAILALGGYKFGFYGEDYELWLRCIHAGYNLNNLPDVLLYYRVHENQMGNTHSVKNIYVRHVLWIYLLHYKKISYLKGIVTQTKLAQFIITNTSRFRKKVLNNDR